MTAQMLTDVATTRQTIHIVDSEHDPLCGTADVPAETRTEQEWVEGFTSTSDQARICEPCEQRASERARTIHATQDDERAPETKRQAHAAFVVAIDLAKAGGLSHTECHEVVDSRPHVG